MFCMNKKEYNWIVGDSFYVLIYGKWRKAKLNSIDYRSKQIKWKPNNPNKNERWLPFDYPHIIMDN